MKFPWAKKAGIEQLEEQLAQASKAAEDATAAFDAAMLSVDSTEADVLSLKSAADLASIRARRAEVLLSAAREEQAGKDRAKLEAALARISAELESSAISTAIAPFVKAEADALLALVAARMRRIELADRYKRKAAEHVRLTHQLEGSEASHYEVNAHADAIARSVIADEPLVALISAHVQALPEGGIPLAPEQVRFVDASDTMRVWMNEATKLIERPLRRAQAERFAAEERAFEERRAALRAAAEQVKPGPYAMRDEPRH
ncbi:MAG: hypothetical protein H5U40_09420 [Polyangiaceae bacterium]|nr:hypothetical protein [Polyangiaceae bacterium]